MNGAGQKPPGNSQGGYERPNQRWVCGWSRDGHPCALGPDGKGRCPSLLESSCTPVGRGDRFECTRPMVFGGPCQNGPLPDGSCCHPPATHPPCQPRPSLRVTRGRIVVGVVLALVGLLALGIGNSHLVRSMIDPGGLSAVHEPIGNGVNGGAGCGACHAGAENGPARWLLLAFAGQDGHGDSERCLACHFRSDREHAFMAHGVEPQQLETAMMAADGNTPKSKGAAKPMPASHSGTGAVPDNLPCGTCHREHRGKYARIAFLTNTECQACHKRKFDSFAGNHPDFPAIKHVGGGIKFDHRLHAREHYGKDQPFVCDDCHELGAAGKAMLSGSYEKTCAGCHNSGDDDHHGTRIRQLKMVAFELPALSLEDGKSPWPKDAKTAIEVAPLMQLLLAGDDAAAKALASLSKDGGDPTDWPTADDHPEYPAALASAIQTLIGEFDSDDPHWLRAEIGDVMHEPADSSKVDDLYGDLRDGADSVRGDLATVIGSISAAADVHQLAEELVTGAKPVASLRDAAVAAGCPGSSAKDREALAMAVSAGKEVPACFKAQLKAISDAKSDLADLRKTAADGLGMAADAAGTKRILGDLFRFGRRIEFRIAHGLAVPLGSPVVEPLARAIKESRPALQIWLSVVKGNSPQAPATRPDESGWTWDAKNQTVVYRSTGHADPLFRAWIDAALSSGAPAGTDRRAVADGFKAKVRETECARCHALDPIGPGEGVVWHSAGRASISGAFAKFDHRPHVALLGDTGCDKCHALAASDKAGAAARGFAKHKKAVCAECHRPGQANTDCLSCHNYHLGAR